jgi:hypothetical protein
LRIQLAVVFSADGHYWHCCYNNIQILTRKSNGGHHAKRRNAEKRKPEEHEGMPQRQHCPHAKRREDWKSEYHEEQQKDVA